MKKMNALDRAAGVVRWTARLNEKERKQVLRAIDAAKRDKERLTESLRLLDIAVGYLTTGEKVHPDDIGRFRAAMRQRPAAKKRATP